MSPFCKGSTLKGRNLGAIFCLLKVDPFVECELVAGKQTGSNKNCLPCKSGRKITNFHVYLDPLNNHMDFFKFEYTCGKEFQFLDMLVCCDNTYGNSKGLDQPVQSDQHLCCH